MKFLGGDGGIKGANLLLEKDSKLLLSLNRNNAEMSTFLKPHDLRGKKESRQVKESMGAGKERCRQT